MRGLPLSLAVVGGLLLAGGTAADWTVAQVDRAVGPGGITLPARIGAPGYAWAAPALPLAVLALLCAPLLSVGRVRRAVALLLGALGASAGLVVAVGVWRAAQQPAGLAAGPGLAGAGALCVLAAAVLGLRAQPPAGDSRYTVEGSRDEEWDLAVEEDSAR